VCDSASPPRRGSPRPTLTLASLTNQRRASFGLMAGPKRGRPPLTSRSGSVTSQSRSVTPQFFFVCQASGLPSTTAARDNAILFLLTLTFPPSLRCGLLF
jgi:hypothetical protein